MMTREQFQANAGQLLLMIDAAGPEGVREGLLFSLLVGRLSLTDFGRCIALLVSEGMVAKGEQHLVTVTTTGAALAAVLNARLEEARKAEALAKAAA